MKKFEYEEHTFVGYEISVKERLKILDDYGSRGWEVVAIESFTTYRNPDPVTEKYYGDNARLPILNNRVYFKREKEEE